MKSQGKAFVKHYFSQHDDPYLPPRWAIGECASFGMWSRTFTILRDPNDKKTGLSLGVPPTVGSAYQDSPSGPQTD